MTKDQLIGSWKLSILLALLLCVFSKPTSEFVTNKFIAEIANRTKVFAYYINGDTRVTHDYFVFRIYLTDIDASTKLRIKSVGILNQVFEIKRWKL